MKRLFTAIKIHPEKPFLDKLHLLESQLRHEKIKWVEDHNIHITLKFFGETEENKIPGINLVLQKVAEGTRSFELSLRNLGIFGSSYNPKVIWVGIEPYHDLVDIMKNIQAGLKETGYEPDRQNMVPHLTLGRIKYLVDKSLFQNKINDFKELNSLPMEITSFHLYESILKKEGPVYISLKTFSFQK
jgi:RNA 2',3'-cyclic 3'-phosphodiesterase